MPKTLSQVTKSSLLPLLIAEMLFGILIASAAFLLFADLSRSVISQEVIGLDQVLSRMIYAYRTPQLTQIMLHLTFLGGSTMLIGASTLIMFWLVWKKYYPYALLYFFTFSMGVLLNLVMKEVIARSRPDIAPLIHEVFYSYPSGHSMNSFVFYTLLAYFTYHFTRNLVVGFGVSILCAIIILFIGISRVYLGVHYPSDVLAGYLAGAAWVVTVLVLHRTLTLYHYLHPKKKNEVRLVSKR